MGNAARILGRAAICTRALREADDDASWREARDTLAGTLRSEALRVLVANGVPAQARDDLAQAVTLSVLDRIVAGMVEPGFEDGYVSVAAKNRARDWHREQSGVHEKMRRCEDDVLVAPGMDPHAALEYAEDGQRLRELATRVARVLETAPARYREVIVAVYLEGVPIDALVEQELFREWVPCDGGDDDAANAVTRRRRARARVDKVLQRARDWLRARLLVDPEEAR
jgi:DNA-directed RNA polymerase specialized sigma24 family protein